MPVAISEQNFWTSYENMSLNDQIRKFILALFFPTLFAVRAEEWKRETKIIFSFSPGLFTECLMGEIQKMLKQFSHFQVTFRPLNQTKFFRE